MARPRITMKQAIEEGIFVTECCGGCGKEAVRLYVLCEGMYSGVRYCRSCAVESLNEGEYL